VELLVPKENVSDEIRRSHTRERLPASARGSEKRANTFGFVPNLLAVIAEAPIALTAYIDLTDLPGKASLNAVEQQDMMLAARYANACGYCMAAHSTAARMMGMPAPVLTALRSRRSSQPQIRGIARFVVEVISRGRVSNKRIEECLSSGYSGQSIGSRFCRIDENSEQLRQSHG
jgi:AhpD family alkylhydroperoxidase